MTEDLSDIPAEVAEIANNVTMNLLPSKSREVYECAYSRFIRWCSEKGANTYCESVLLAYFAHLATKMKSSTLWAQYSMVKSTLNLKNGIDIGKYFKLNAFLKRQNENYTPKKARVFTKKQVDEFLDAAPDTHYLMIKVCLT